MYRPAYTRADDTVAREIVRAEPFAVLARVVSGDVALAYAPLYVDGADLVGHLARANPFTRDLDGARVTASFRGPHGYVSPTWYAEPAAHVPTWNYVAAEAVGVAVVVDPLPALAFAVAAHEPDWRPDPARAEELARGIVAFRIVAPTIVAKLKLSQNRSPEDHDRVAAVFDGRDPALAAWMRR